MDPYMAFSSVYDEYFDFEDFGDITTSWNDHSFDSSTTIPPEALFDNQPKASTGMNTTLPLADDGPSAERDNNTPYHHVVDICLGLNRTEDALLEESLYNRAPSASKPTFHSGKRARCQSSGSECSSDGSWSEDAKLEEYCAMAEARLKGLPNRCLLLARLSHGQRQVLHTLAHKRQLNHMSFGKDKSRCIVLSKSIIVSGRSNLRQRIVSGKTSFINWISPQSSSF